MRQKGGSTSFETRLVSSSRTSFGYHLTRLIWQILCTMTLFDHFRLSRQNTRSNPGSNSNSRASSPVRDSASPHGTPPSTHHHNHFTSFFTQHHATSSSNHSATAYSDTSHSSSKKKEYEFFPHASPIGSGGYSDVVKARWKAREGMVVAVKVVRKEAIKDHAEYLKIIRT
jgi:hypothetical protein